MELKNNLHNQRKIYGALRIRVMPGNGKKLNLKTDERNKITNHRFNG